MLDVDRIREDFPILKRLVHGRPLVYLDNAATSQKPKAVIEALVDFYSQTNANIHRGIHVLSEEATALYEGARETVARFIGASKSRSVVFTRNTTEAINLARFAWGNSHIKAGDEIECPRHGARFNVKTGRPVTLPAVVLVRTFPVTVTEEGIFVQIE